MMKRLRMTKSKRTIQMTKINKTLIIKKKRMIFAEAAHEKH
jgi:hypothetical protein